MATGHKYRFSVVVPAYNEEGYLAGCLDSLLNQDFDRSLYEIIVVDNASTDATRRVAKRRGVKVVSEGRKGYVFALNRGFREAQGEIVAFTDADSRAPKDWLSKFHAGFEKEPETLAIGGLFSFYDAGRFVKKFGDLLCRLISDPPGTNMAVKREFLQKTGGFDEKVNLGADSLLSLKAKRVGKVFIDKENVVLTSARRYHRQGFVRSQLMYLPSYLSLLIRKKPLFFDFPDIR